MSNEEAKFSDLLGCFVPFEQPDYILSSIRRGISYGANSIMLYLAPPKRLGAPNIEKLKFDKYYQSQYKDSFPLSRVVVHAPYVINPASDKFSIQNNTRNTLKALLSLMTNAGLELIVLHPGSYVNQTKAAGINNLISLVRDLLIEFPKVTIALETMSGKGNQLCSSLEEIASIVKRIDLANIAICLDTCHLWDAGYNVQDPKQIIAKLEELDILRYVKVIHLNDSKFERYSKRDVHANLGRGTIGYQALREWTREQVFQGIPFILETPSSPGFDIYKEELALLRGTAFEDLFDEFGNQKDIVGG